MKRRTLYQATLIIIFLLLLAASLSQAQQPDATDSQPQTIESAIGTAFTYQGQLVYNGAPVNDQCDFSFTMFNDVLVGDQIGETIAKTITVGDGLFSTVLDFGVDAFDGGARWLEIAACCPSTCTPTTLDPRQELTPAPYALYTPPNNSLVAADGDPIDAVYVNNEGDVGIGTTSPGERLTVAGAVESTSGGFRFPDGTTQTTAAGGSAGDIKQLVQDFVVASGESVTAGDVVQFLDGYILRDSVYGTEEVFNPASTLLIATAVLSSTKFVVVYKDEGNSQHGKAVIGDISGATITYGSSYSFNAAITDWISVTSLSSTQFVVAYADVGNSEYGTAIIGEASGTIISFGSEYVFNSAKTPFISVAALSSTQFVVTYSDNGNSSYGTAMIGDVSDTTITYGSEYVFNTALTYPTSTAALSSTQFVVAYGDSEAGGQGAALIGTVSGTSISYGSEYVFNSASTDWICTAVLSSNKFVIAFRDIGNSGYGTAMIGSVSGATVNYGSEYVFNPADTSYIAVVASSSTRFVVTYTDGDNSNYGTEVAGKVTGINISYGSEYVFAPTVRSYTATALLSSNKFVVAYRDNSNSGYGIAVIGNVFGNTVGIAKESKVAGQVVSVIIGGVSDVHSGLIPGSIYYSDIAGDLTYSETARRIGLAISEIELLLDINIY